VIVLSYSKAKAIKKGQVMSVTLREVIEHGGYDLNTKEDSNWLISKQVEFEELVERAEETMEIENYCELHGGEMGVNCNNGGCDE